MIFPNFNDETPPLERPVYKKTLLEGSSAVTNFWIAGGHLYTENEEGILRKHLLSSGEEKNVFSIRDHSHILEILPQCQSPHQNHEWPATVTASKPLGETAILSAANKRFCVMAYKEPSGKGTQIDIRDSSTFEPLYVCYVTSKVSAIALKRNRLFLGTQEGDLYFQDIDQHYIFLLPKPQIREKGPIERILIIRDRLLFKTPDGTFQRSMRNPQKTPKPLHIQTIRKIFNAQKIAFSQGEFFLLRKGRVEILDYNKQEERYLHIYIKTLHKVYEKTPLKNIHITDYRGTYRALLGKITVFSEEIRNVIFRAMAAQNGKEDLASGEAAFYNEETPHQQRLGAFKAYFDEKKRSEKSDECSAPVHPTSSPDRGEGEPSCTLPSQGVRSASACTAET